ncbi:MULTISPECIES: uracil-DNA glycosylase family protein [unclassified Paludibacterium]|uniref:uracil-DNA glycosylase n=1 Tax=unclassified Paludibacterium TaxID=2618429 RepID=UPI001C04A687|nr:uracil-DNA glycosylase [Paludibacterium sp. B53371]BEV71909.1 hypothetical protein THUN1379_13910 [Paludibacterium sp. THUN1379]
MSRKAQLVEAMGLGPIWQARPGAHPEHAGLSWLQQPVAAPLPAPEAIDLPLAAQTEPLRIVNETPPPATAPSPVAPTEIERPAVSSERLSWPALQQAVQHCQQCRLCDTRTQAVFGRGNPQARWLLVGEAPGEHEDRQGEPFVGRAGQLLDNMLAAAGLSAQDDVFIANVLKCRPPGNRNPAGDEIAACQHFLWQQIDHIQPDIILALGRFAAQTLLQTEQSISRLRGQVHDFRGRRLIVSYHPAYLLRNPPDKAKAWQDWVLAKRTLDGQP